VAISFTNVTSARIQGVGQAFYDACNAFNKPDYATYLNFLDPNVVVYNVSSVNYILGRANAKTQWLDKIKDPELFVPTNEISFFPLTYPLSVRGVALWTHKASGHVKVPIHYEVQFAPGSFLITSVWAEHAH
jgi:hypothetical protein